MIYNISIRIYMPHYILYALNRDDVVVARIQLRFSAGDYQVQASAISDSSSWSSSPWITITDGPHSLEIDWQAASAVGANNGVLTFWVDGNQQANFSNMDNDTRRVDKARLGAVTTVDTGTRGVYYFDAFESRRQSYIGPANGAPQPPPFPARPDDLFADSFESGDLSAWSASATDSGDLSVTAQAALSGAYGMQAVIDNNTGIYVTDWKPFEGTRYRARFYFDPNSITMASGNAHYLFYALNRDGVVVARIELQYASSSYQVRAAAVNDASAWSTTAWTVIGDAPHSLEIDWQASAAAGANNGALAFWVDGVQKGSFSNIDNDTRRVDKAQFGAVAGIDTATRGTYYFDGFVSRRQSYIGQASLQTMEISSVAAPVRHGGGKVLAMLAPVTTAPQVGAPEQPQFAPLAPAASALAQPLVMQLHTSRQPCTTVVGKLRAVRRVQQDTPPCCHSCNATHRCSPPESGARGHRRCV